MMNPAYVVGKARRLLEDYQDDNAREVATQALDIFEQALIGCTPTKEAVERDGCNDV